MKKFIYSVLALAFAAYTLTSCEDVPAPYNTTFDDNNNKPEPSNMVAKGIGTKDDPFNIVAAQNYITKGENLDKEVYVKGIIASIKEVNTQYGNATYYISDDGTTSNQFYVFRGKNLGNESFTNANEIKTGDEVIICGKLMTHTNGVKQLGQGNYIYSLNGKTQNTTPSANIGLDVTFDKDIAGFSISNLKTLPADLTQVWTHDAKYKQMKASARANNVNYETQSRLVSPAFSLKGVNTATLTFNNALNFLKTMPLNNAIKVLVSTDGNNWESVAINNPPSGNSWTFVDSTCDLNKYAGKENVFVAFEYNSTTDIAPTWEIKTVTVK